MKYVSMVAGLLLAGSSIAAQAQGISVRLSGGQPTSIGATSAGHLAEIAAEKGIATIQVQNGLVLTKSIQEVADGSIDMTVSPFALPFLMSKGLGPYQPLGAEGGAELASNLRIIYPFHIASFYLKSYASSSVRSYADLEGKSIHNGPPGGGALVMARQMLQAVTGLEEGKGYVGKQVDWSQQTSVMLDGSVDAQLIPGANPDSNIPVLAAAGKVQIISVPKDVFEGEAFQRLTKTPGRVAVIWKVSDFAHYGDTVEVISEDDTFRTAGEAGGIFVHKNMDKALVKKMVSAFLDTLPDLYRKVPYARTQNAGLIDESIMGMCRAKLKLHPGAVEAYEEAGYTVEDCQKP